MVSLDTVRRLALALPQAREQDHHGFPSFRVGKKIFATMPDDRHLHLMLDADRIREAVAIDPVACEEKWWGAKLAALRVSLDDTSEDVVVALLYESWRRHAPKTAR